MSACCPSAQHPWVYKLVEKSNSQPNSEWIYQIRAEPKPHTSPHPHPHPSSSSSHTRFASCTSQKLLRCFSQSDLSWHSSTSKNKDTQERSARDATHSTRTQRNQILPQTCDQNPLKSVFYALDPQINQKKKKLIVNLLHVVSRRSLHVAFQSSRTLPENRNPAATRYVPRHTWQNGRATRRGRKKQWENERRSSPRGHDAMTHEIWNKDMIL